MTLFLLVLPLHFPSFLDSLKAIHFDTEYQNDQKKVKDKIIVKLLMKRLEINSGSWEVYLITKPFNFQSPNSYSIHIPKR